MTMRIGLTQRMEWLSSRREMRQTLDAAWGEALADLGVIPVALPMRGMPVEALVRDFSLDALLITGGNSASGTAGDPASAERNAREGSLLRFAAMRSLPVLGVCYGLQIINVHLGGSLCMVQGHVRTVHAVAGPLSALTGVSEVNSYHDDGISSQGLARALAAVVTAADGTVEAAVHREHAWLGIMWHPERTMPAGSPVMGAVREFLRDPEGFCGALRKEAA